MNKLIADSPGLLGTEPNNQHSYDAYVQDIIGKINEVCSADKMKMMMTTTTIMSLNHISKIR